MEEVYIIDGEEISLAEIQEAATASEMEVEEYLSLVGAQLKGEVEKQQATEETANFVAEDEAALESMNTDLTSDNVLSDYDIEVQKINSSYDEEINNLDVTEADKKEYSSFDVEDNVVETKTTQLNDQRTKEK